METAAAFTRSICVLRSGTGTHRRHGLGRAFARRGCARLGHCGEGVPHARRGPCNASTAEPRRRPRYHGRAVPAAMATSRLLPHAAGGGGAPHAYSDPRKRFFHSFSLVNV